MKNQNPLLRFFLQSLIAAVLTVAVITPITALGVPDNLYVSANQDGGSIFEYTPDGTQITFASTPRFPRGLAFDSNGNLFAATSTVSGNHGTVLKFNPAGAQHTFGGAPGFLSGLAVDSTGDVFVMSEDPKSGTPSTIFKFTASGTRSVFGSLPGQGFGLAFNSAGNLFAVTPSTKLSSNTRRAAPGPLSSAQQPSAPIKLPRGSWPLIARAIFLFRP